MKHARLNHAIMLVISLVFVVAITVFRSIAISSGFDPEVGYFKSDCGFAKASSICSFIYVVAALVWSLVSCTGRRIASNDPTFARFSALAVGAVSCFMLATQFSSAFDGEGALSVIASVFLLLGLSYFLLTYLSLTKPEPYRAIGAMCLVFFGLFYVLHYYFLDKMPINGDLKTAHILCAMSFFMFFLVEAKRILRKSTGTSNRFFSLCAFLYCTSVSMAELVGHFTNEKADFESYTVALFFFSVGIYAFIRLCAERPKPTSDAVTVTLPSEQAAQPEATETQTQE
ncbi:MAG: hypothetical protein J6V82_00380 [Clostridia bacterium]|nr:hypothetical protein [Clostridia bacterium]